jgi:hypothetical protein
MCVQDQARCLWVAAMFVCIVNTQVEHKQDKRSENAHKLLHTNHAALQYYRGQFKHMCTFTA